MRVNFKEYVVILDQKFRVLVPDEMKNIELYKCDSSENYRWSGNDAGLEYLKYALYILACSAGYRNTIIYFPFKQKNEDELVFSSCMSIVKEDRWNRIKYFMKHMGSAYYSGIRLERFWAEKFEREMEYWNTLRNSNKKEMSEMKKENTLFQFIPREEAVFQYLAFRKGEENEFGIKCNSR